jgi:hypothetical protein
MVPPTFAGCANRPKVEKLSLLAGVREQHQSSYRVHTAIGRSANRGTDRGRDL